DHPPGSAASNALLPSTEPRSEERGDSGCVFMVYFWGNLQRSRAPKSAETAGASPIHSLAREPSTAPRSEERGDAGHGRAVAVSVGPSTEPRSEERGDPPTMTLPERSQPSFNGAALRRARRQLGGALMR